MTATRLPHDRQHRTRYMEDSENARRKLLLDFRSRVLFKGPKSANGIHHRQMADFQLVAQHSDGTDLKILLLFKSDAFFWRAGEVSEKQRPYGPHQQPP